jgi:hypothetical protein
MDFAKESEAKSKHKSSKNRKIGDATTGGGGDSAGGGSGDAKGPPEPTVKPKVVTAAMNSKGDVHRKAQ